MMWDDHARYWHSASVPENDEHGIWELFHENSKISPFSDFMSTEQVRAVMASLQETATFEGYPTVELPEPSTDAGCDAFDLMFRRYSPPALGQTPVTMQALSDIAFYGYGVTRTPEGHGDDARSFRTVPSGGALYPLEVYFAARDVTGLEAGLYHFDPIQHRLTRLADRACCDRIGAAFIQRDVADGAPLLMLVCGNFYRSTFKYGARGYRFALIEAGHVLQNANLAACAAGLALRPLAGYFDRQLDAALSLDGLNQSIIYAGAIGHPAVDPTLGHAR